MTEPLPLCLRATDGAVVGADGTRWLGAPPPEEDAVLDLASAPVLDVGCGPGRHVSALAARGVMALGLDITPSAVRLARRRGALVLERSVFDHVPGRGRWGSALLLDGNIGIGGDPAALLTRLAVLLRPGGRVLAELEGPAVAAGRETVRLEERGRAGPWFAWTRVGVFDLPALVDPAAFRTADIWCSADRWFACLERA